jgi:hypothetical protein
MKRNIAITLLLLNSFLLLAADVFTINGREIIVPVPRGFARVTEDMPAAMGIAQQQADADSYNDTLAYYIKESEVPTAMEGYIPDMEKSFILKVNKEMRNMTIGKDSFSQFKSMTKKHNRQVFENIKAQIPEVMNNFSQGVSQEFNIDFAISVSQVVPLETHYEAENAMALSMFVNYGSSAGDEKIEEIISATSTFLNASGAVLFLYAYGPRDELEWTRSASKAWAESVMASNSKPLSKTPGQGLDWTNASVGVIVGGLIALIATAFGILRRKS